MARKKKLSTELKQHSALAMSAAHRWLACPGSVFLSSQCPEQGQSKYAAEGTQAHAVAEAILTDVLVNNGNLFQSYHDHMNLCSDTEMADHVLNYCLEVTKIMLSTKLLKLAVEKRFILDEALDLGGTADVAFTCISPAGKNVGCIIDLKYGQGTLVEVTDNPQLLGYACAMDADPDWGPLDRAVIYIYQPRCPHPDGILRALKISRPELDTWKTRLVEGGKTAVAQFDELKPVYQAGDHCQWCPAQAICLKRATHIRGEAGVDFLPDVEKPELPEPTTLTDEQVRRVVLHRAQIESFLKRTEEYAMGRAMEGRDVAGLKLVYGKGAGRRWAGKPEEVATALTTRGVIDPWDKKLKGIGAIEKEIGEGKLDDLTLKPEAPLKIVSVDDKREAVKPNRDTLTLDFTGEQNESSEH